MDPHVAAQIKLDIFRSIIARADSTSVEKAAKEANEAFSTMYEAKPSQDAPRPE